MTKIDEKILICIFNYRHDENARRWKRILSPYFRTIVLDSGNDKFCDDFIQYPNIYYSGLWNEMKRYSENGNYEWTGIICSDVEIDDENARKLINRIKWLKTTENVGCWSLIGNSNGHSNRYVYANVCGKKYRCFEGFFQFINTKIITNIDYIDTNLNLYGYGIDFLTCFTSNKLGYINVCQEDIEIFHPKEKGYDGVCAKFQSDVFSKYIRETKYEGYKINGIEYQEKQPNMEGEILYKENLGGGVRKCLYTCISGNYDTLYPIKKEEGWDYVCFTNLDIESNCWEIREIPEELKELSQVKQQRMIKILPEIFLPEYDVTIWIDANLTVNNGINDFYEDCCNDSLSASFKQHPYRNCIYEEFKACIDCRKEKANNIERIKKRYLDENFLSNYGLFETNVIIRNNKDKKVKELMEMWAKEVKENSHRDQLSLNYCIWKLNCKDIINVFKQSDYYKYFTWHDHKPMQLTEDKFKSIYIDNSQKTNNTMQEKRIVTKYYTPYHPVKIR